MKIYISNNTNSRISWKIKRIIKVAIRASIAKLASGHAESPLSLRDIPPLARGVYEVSVVLVNNAEIHELNLLHRNMDKPTDVLSFPMDDEETLGDIVISLEQAQIQANDYGHSLEREIGFLTVHSMLHLFGFDHETSEEDETEMFALQDEILGKMKLGR